MVISLNSKPCIRALSGSYIAPVTNDAQLLRWRETKIDYVNLVDHVTRRLARPDKLLPMGREGKQPNDYERRYVCLPLANKHPCFSVGARNPFDGQKTPIWMRFNRATPMFPVIHDRLLASSLSPRLVDSGGDIWIPLDLLYDVDRDRQVDSLVAQAKDVINVAYQPLA